MIVWFCKFKCMEYWMVQWSLLGEHLYPKLNLPLNIIFSFPSVCRQQLFCRINQETTHCLLLAFPVSALCRSTGQCKYWCCSSHRSPLWRIWWWFRAVLQRNTWEMDYSKLHPSMGRVQEKCGRYQDFASTHTFKRASHNGINHPCKHAKPLDFTTYSRVSTRKL